jgi:hypothetical protein
MKVLHSLCLAFHAVIAGTYAHECYVAIPADPHHYILTAAYLALTVAQAVLLFTAANGSQHSEPPVM